MKRTVRIFVKVGPRSRLARTLLAVLVTAVVLTLLVLVLLGFWLIFVVCAVFAIIAVLVRALFWPGAPDKFIDGKYSVVEEGRIAPVTPSNQPSHLDRNDSSPGEIRSILNREKSDNTN